MNWNAVAAIAEGLGALGVIASLLYLAVQVRQSTKVARLEAKLTTTGLLDSYTDLFIADPALRDLFLRGRDGIEGLEERDYFQFSDLCLKAFWYFSAARFQVREGMISEEEWHEVRAVLHYYLRGPGVRAWWAKVRGVMFGPEFTAFIDDQIRGMTSRR